MITRPSFITNTTSSSAAISSSGRPLVVYPGPEQEAEIRRLTHGGTTPGAASKLILGYEGWWGLPALPKLRVDHPDTRAFLLDVAGTRGVSWMERGEGVMPADLEAAERSAGVRVEPGDILLVRTGHYGRRLAEGPVNPLTAGSPGPHVALIPWLRERGVAMWGSDTHNDVTPTPYPSMGHPFHICALVGLGLWLIDNMNLEDLARACAERRRPQRVRLGLGAQ